MPSLCQDYSDVAGCACQQACPQGGAFCHYPFPHGHLKACFFIHLLSPRSCTFLHGHWTALLRSINRCHLFKWQLTLLLGQLFSATLAAVLCCSMSSFLPWQLSSVAWKTCLLFMHILDINSNLKVHKIENFFGSDFEFCVISLLFMLKYQCFVKNIFWSGHYWGRYNYSA